MENNVIGFQARTKNFTLRFTEEEFKYLQFEASKKGKKAGTFLRDLLIQYKLNQDENRKDSIDK